MSESRPLEVSGTYTCTGCGGRVFPIATERGNALTCGCTDEDGVHDLVWELRHSEFPERWEHDEAALMEVYD